MGSTRSATFFLVVLLLLVSLPNPNTVSADTEVDNWPQTDAWLRIDLISWTANDSVEWDNNGGLPDPKFKVCVEADGDRLDCVNTPTWDNQLTLNNSWNYTIDIPDDSNILNVTIECKDNDAFNSDECDMNSDVNYWRLYAEYNWSQNPNMTIVGNGDGDGDDTWKNAASIWKFTIDGYGDEDGDGITDNIDFCSSTPLDEIVLDIKLGCSWGQMDADMDGVQNSDDSFPYSYNLNGSHTHGANYSGWNDAIFHIEVQEGYTHYWDSYTANLAFEPPFKLPHPGEIRFDVNQDGIYDQTNIGTDSLGQGISISSDTRVPLVLEYDDFCNYVGPNSCTVKFFDIGSDGSMEMITDSGIFTYHQRNYSLVTEITNCGGRLGHQPQVQTEPNTGYEVILCPGSGNNYRVVFVNNYSVHSVHNFDSQYSSSNSLDWWDRVGGLGDINSDGFIDLVRQNESTGCDIFLGSIDGLSAQGVSLHSTNINDCKGPLTLLDMDLNGEVDIVSSGALIFQVDGSFSWIGYTSSETPLFAKPMDWDDDGDLDIVYLGKTASQDAPSYLYVSYNPSFVDTDSDGIRDSDDLCSATPTFEIIDSDGCSDSQKDTDMDGITDSIDLCPNTQQEYDVNSEGCASNQLDSDGDGISDEMDVCPITPNGETVNLEGCSQSQIDSDDDGVVNSNDTCPNTISGSVVDENGCSDAQLDPDSDGVIVTLDRCPDTPRGAEVSYYGCSANQGDEDLDGVLNEDDECPNSRFVDTDKPPEASDGCDGWFESRDDDDDGDGLVNSYDDCPNTPYGELIDGDGCSSAQREELANGSSSDFDFGAAILGPICVLGIVGLVLILSPKNKKRIQHTHVNLQASPPVVVQQNVSAPQISPRERHLEDQSRQAQFEAQRLRQELANQAQITQRLQSEAAQKQMSDAALAQKQQELAIAQKEKQDLEAKLAEAEKSTQIVQNITYNITDSAISGDITNKIIRDDTE